jgi:hypothetical protein
VLTKLHERERKNQEAEFEKLQNPFQSQEVELESLMKILSVLYSNKNVNNIHLREVVELVTKKNKDTFRSHGTAIIK